MNNCVHQKFYIISGAHIYAQMQTKLFNVAFAKVTGSQSVAHKLLENHFLNKTVGTKFV